MGGDFKLLSKEYPIRALIERWKALGPQKFAVPENFILNE